MVAPFPKDAWKPLSDSVAESHPPRRGGPSNVAQCGQAAWRPCVPSRKAPLGDGQETPSFQPQVSAAGRAGEPPWRGRKWPWGLCVLSGWQAVWEPGWQLPLPTGSAKGQPGHVQQAIPSGKPAPGLLQLPTLQAVQVGTDLSTLDLQGPCQAPPPGPPAPLPIAIPTTTNDSDESKHLISS